MVFLVGTRSVDVAVDGRGGSAIAQNPIHDLIPDSHSDISCRPLDKNN